MRIALLVVAGLAAYLAVGFPLAVLVGRALERASADCSDCIPPTVR